MSIRSKLILFMLALLTTVSAVMAFLFLHSELSSISANSQRKNIQILLAMSEVCKEISDTPGSSSAYRYFKTFLKTPEIIQVSCSDSRGRLFMNDTYYRPFPLPLPYRFKEFPAPRIGRWETQSDDGVGTLKASLSAKNSKKKQITAHVDFSTQLIGQEMDSSLRHSSASFFIILSIAFAIGCAGTLIITRVVFAPIESMAEGARMIGSGRFDHRIPVTSKDEMGRLASELNDMAVKLKEVSDMKQDFVSSITHDLRSPVTGIELCSDIIQKLAANREYGKIPEQVVSINEHSQRLNRYIDSLLELAKIESGKMTLDVKAVNLEELADRSVRAFKAYAEQKGLKLELIVGAEIPDTRGDPDRLYQVLSNIIGNAVKFTNSGSVEVFIEAAPGWQKVRVCDTGVGIPAREMGNIFGKFYRITHGKRGYPAARQGTGLGLFIAKYILEQHGGRIEVESKEGKGSVFTAFIPA
ncbi:MAG TPA: HAMP domain-containing sensor histidine kinase [Elusimicrobiales bacterium]|nr:HAMP domain-containing sensor histidine kinase [Elusimicrobiales bacterium]